MSLDLLGAGEGLGTQYITLRVKRIDPARLEQKVGRVAAALPVVDLAPEPTLRAALPIATKMIRDDYGIDLDWQISDAPPGKGALAQNSGFGWGVGAGVGLAAVGWLLSKLF